MTRPRNARRPTRRPAPRERGITFLEIVAAVALLGLASATFSTTTGYVLRSQVRQRERLGAAEIANRLMLMFLDDKNTMPSDNLPVEYDGIYYRWKVDLSPVLMTLDPASNAEGQQRSGGLSLDRIKLVSLTVWLGTESGGSWAFDPNVANVTLNRLYDPLAFDRNPESTRKALSTDEGIRDLLNELIQLESGGGGGRQ